MKKIITAPFTKVLIKTILLSVIANVVLLLIVRPIANAPTTFSPFMYSPVIILTVFGVIGAGIVYLIIKRLWPTRVNKIFVIVSVIALLLSLIPDLQLPYSQDADNLGATWFIVNMLMLMHVLTAGIVVWLFTKK
jgi:hypothetical protein